MNHNPEGGSKGADSPEVFSADLSHEDLEKLAQDLEECAEGFVVRARDGDRDLSDSSELRPRDLPDLFRSKSGRLSVQVRYLYEGRRWCDTLTLLGERIRLIRIDLDSAFRTD